MADSQMLMDHPVRFPGNQGIPLAMSSAPYTIELLPAARKRLREYTAEAKRRGLASELAAAVHDEQSLVIIKDIRAVLGHPLSSS